MVPVLALAFAVVGGAPGAPPAGGYVESLCAPFVLNDESESALEADLRRWGARPTGDAEADAGRPDDVPVSGQMFKLSDPDAPHLFLDRRRGACALVFSGAKAPEAVVREFSGGKLAVGDHGAPSPWRRVRSQRPGAPGPDRYFLKVGDREGFGLCGSVAEDLRFRDGRPATLVTVGVCRLRPTEALDNG